MGSIWNNAYSGKVVTANGSALSEAQSIGTLTKSSGEGWSQGTDQYGDVTYVKINAGATKTIIVK